MSPARVVYDDLGPIDRAEVDQLLGIIELDPWLDGRFKFHEPQSGIDYYDNGSWTLTYRIADHAFVEIYGVYKAMPPYRFRDSGTIMF